MSMTTRGRVLAAFAGLITGSIAAVALLFAMVIMVQPAKAADLKGGGCCSDLEERVAELEALASTKGNRKVTVTIYGQVNEAILFTDAFKPLTGKWSRGVVDNTAAPTMLGVTGGAKISPDWKVGYRIELGVNQNPAIPVLDSQVEIRHAAVWLEGPVGKFTAGRTSMATDGAGSVSVANTAVASKLLSLEPLSTSSLFGINLPYDNSNTLRRDVVRWDSPAMAGFILSASWSSGAGVSLLGAPIALIDNKDTYDISLRWANELGGFRLAGAVGYRKENYLVPLIPLPIPTPALGRDSVIVASGSVMHVASGLFVNAAGGWAKDEGGFPGCSSCGTDHNTYHVQAGMEKKLNALGATTLFGEYGRFNVAGTTGNPSMLGAGVVQKVDSAAMDLYASFRVYDMDNSSPKINAIMTGVRIQF